MKTTRKLSRRSFLGRVAGGAIAGGGALVVLGGTAQAFQVTDSDNGPNSDPAGNAPARRRACTDADSGPNSDPANRGRGNGVTDSDSGPNSDPPRCGRRRR